MITIVDYGLGNLGSIQNMFKKVGAESLITSDIEKISSAKKILLPGVGAFDAAIERIDKLGFRQVLNQKATVEKVPFLGICLGMQLLAHSSEEGHLPGLGYVNGHVKRFKLEDKKLKVPHMGWNEINITNNSPLTQNFEDDCRFYFVHSYYMECVDSKNVNAETTHGITFHSVVYNDNVFGAQFHPEKSHKFGMKMFENFSKI